MEGMERDEEEEKARGNNVLNFSLPYLDVNSGYGWKTL